MRKRLSMDRIARGLGAERRGLVSPRAGYFGALALVAEVQARFPGSTPAVDPARKAREQDGRSLDHPL